MFKRIITALVLLPPIIAIIVTDSPVLFLILMTLCAVQIAREILSFAPVPVCVSSRIITYTAITAMYGAKFIIFRLDTFPLAISEIYLIILVVSVLITGLFFIFRPSHQRYFNDTHYSLYAMIIAGIIFSYSLDIRISPFGTAEQIMQQGPLSIFPEIFLRSLSGIVRADIYRYAGSVYFFFILMVCWMFDTGGYVIGAKYGRKKLGLTASPNKSWAGAAGGVLFTTAAYVLFYLLLKNFFPNLFSITIFYNRFFYGLIISAILGILSLGFDLFESIMKRCAGVKDSGTILAGHGGLLDAVDSIIPSLFIFYYFINIIHPFFY